MSELTIASSRGGYRVLVASGAAVDAVQGAAVTLIDERVADSGGIDISGMPSIVVTGGEDTKTLGGCERILAEMNRLGTRRGDLLVAVGGGSVQDAATFVSSFYMRGIPWSYVPSTAMAMADSCIGGKSSINIAGIKNLGGNIYPPVEVTIDPTLARSLPVDAKISGLAEAVKICFAAGPTAFEKYLDLAVPPREFGQDGSTDALLLHVLACKKWFIEVDEFDRAERQLLNFGHTFAHALESGSGFAVPHGVAVALGVLAALAHPASASDAWTNSLRRYCIDLLRPITGEVGQLSTMVDWDRFDTAITSDKKGTRESFRLVLPRAGGGVEIVERSRGIAELAGLRDCMKNALAEAAS